MGRIRVWHVANSFGYGGTERAMECWVRGLDPRIFQASAFSRGEGGPRQAALRRVGRVAERLGTDLGPWRKRLAKERPQLLHFHRHGEADASWDALALEARRFGVRVLVETNVFGEARRLIAPEAPDAVYCMSAMCLRRLLGRLGLGLEVEAWTGRFGALYLPLEPELFARPVDTAERKAARRALAVPQDAFIVGRLGRPDPNKFPTWLLSAFGRHARNAAGSQLLLMEAPAGALREAAMLGLEGRVHFLKARTDWRGIRQVYAALDALFHGSRVGESFGYTLAEAQALGLPVLADVTPWADNAQVELLKHGQTALLAMRPAALTRVLDDLAADPGLRQRLGRAGRVWALKQFSAGPLVRDLEGRYARLLAGKGVRTPALDRLAPRPCVPTEEGVERIMRDYPSAVQRRAYPHRLADPAFALSSTLRLYGRGWVSRALRSLGLKKRGGEHG